MAVHVCNDNENLFDIPLHFHQETKPYRRVRSRNRDPWAEILSEVVPNKPAWGITLSSRTVDQ